MCGPFKARPFPGRCERCLQAVQHGPAGCRRFRQKDLQQCAVVRRMTFDLNLPIDIVTVPTVREPDGLAMSSRNRYLSAPERKRALAISRRLLSAETAFREGERDPVRLHRLSGLPLRRWMSCNTSKSWTLKR
nr:pantoate--beta-alanine ligase [Bradyrhizobium sp. 151]